MYKLGRYLYELGERRAAEKLKSELYYFLGWQPERRIDEDAGMSESEEHYQKRLDGWFEARKLIEEFFVELEVARRRKK